MVKIMKQAGLTDAHIRHLERVSNLARVVGAGADEVFAEIKVKAIKAWERTSRTLTRRAAAPSTATRAATSRQATGIWPRTLPGSLTNAGSGRGAREFADECNQGAER